MATSSASVRRARGALVALGIVLLTVLALPLADARASADVRFGTWSPNEPYWGSVAGVDALQARSGRAVEIVNWYQNWGGGSWISSVQPQIVRAVTDSGRTPLLTWEPWDPAAGVDQPAYRLARIADGTFDAYMATFARGLRDLGRTVYLRPMHEMNGSWYPWSGGVNANTAADYVQAWRRMHAVFAAQGATNVRWVWSPNNFDVSAARPLESFYPGDAYVDVLAVDGYNWGSTAPQFGGWLTFEQVFRNAYDRLAALGPQPIWIAEVGSAPEGGDKAAWVRDMFARAAQMDRLAAIVWFNENKERDWRADPDDTVAAAFAPAVAAILPEPTPLPAPAPPSAPKPTPQPAPSTQDGTAGSPATATADAGQDAPAGESGAAAMRLRLYAPRRVRAGTRATLRWSAPAATRRRVARWDVYLDGRRVCSVAATTSAPRHSRRMRTAGAHRWRVEGRTASGTRVIASTRAFEVLETYR